MTLTRESVAMHPTPHGVGLVQNNAQASLGTFVSSGLPVSREPAYDATRSHDGEAAAPSE
jgi:hypothetical protein